MERSGGGEKLRNAHAREVEFTLPGEPTQAEAIGLAREFVEREFVARGTVANLNIHWDEGNPHAPTSCSQCVR